MVNYQLGKIYRIVCNTTGLVYVGSTCEATLARRIQGHKNHYKRYLKIGGRSITSFAILENDNYEIILIESFPCNSKDELHKRERFYIESMDCVNKVIPTRPKKEQKNKYYEENKEKIDNYQMKYRAEHKEENFKYNKEYYTDNKQTILENQKMYRESHIDDIKNYRIQYYQNTKAKVKENGKKYREENKEIIKERKKRYYEKNKDKIKERQRQNRVSQTSPVVSL
jgi:hypothetical protein